MNYVIWFSALVAIPTAALIFLIVLKKILATWKEAAFYKATLMLEDLSMDMVERSNQSNPLSKTERQVFNGRLDIVGEALDKAGRLLEEKSFLGSEKRYAVDFYDMCDGWCHFADLWPEYLFDSLEQARKKADDEYKELAENNKNAGEHYAVYDNQQQEFVYSTKKP